MFATAHLIKNAVAKKVPHERHHWVMLILSLGEFVFAVVYISHGDFLPIYMAIAAVYKERHH